MIFIKIIIGKILYRIDINRQNKCDRLDRENQDNEYAQEIISWNRRWKLPIEIYINILDGLVSYSIQHRKKYKDTKYYIDMSIYYQMSYKYYRIVKNRLLMFINLIFYFRDYKDY